MLYLIHSLLIVVMDGRPGVSGGQERRSGDHRKITKFYVSNHPTGCTPWELSSFLGVFGEIVGTYIARKTDKEGNRFGFMSFKDMRNIADLERNLLNVKMGGNKLKINIARFAVENADFLAKVAATKKKKANAKHVQQPASQGQVRG
ncbi:putative RNA recognition motif domain, nucleotide-binding alpha-beta plait domain superfamily [Helianthus annuus]|nr:putative RNA recognition motif domain, nucleotide-binding alpha-beta plait domain superfamily [Helianthus annuus]